MCETSLLGLHIEGDCTSVNLCRLLQQLAIAGSQGMHESLLFIFAFEFEENVRGSIQFWQH